MTQPQQRKPQPRPAQGPVLYVREWRTARGMSQDALAAAMDVNRSMISLWETGARRPSAVNQTLLAAALGIEPADLLRRPGTLSADAMLRGIPADKRQRALAALKVILDVDP